MSKKTTWERTSVQNLLRNRDSGRYFGRWTVGGKQIWVKLDTDVFSVAKLRLADEAAKIESRRRTASNITAGKGTMADLIRVYADRTRANTDLKPSSITARLVALKKISKTWPELEGLKPSAVGPEAVQEWATRFKGNGTGFTPPGAKTMIKGNSATSVNRAVDTLRRLFDIAIERGAIHRNPVSVKPADGRRLKKKITRAKLVLPAMADVQRLFSAMENNGSRGGWGIEAADLCRFLYTSGCRIGEVPGLTWQCVDRERKQLKIHGSKTEESDRTVPLFPELDALLARIAERRKRAAVYAEHGIPMLGPTDRVFRLSECQKTIDKACEGLGIARITHHDFRHLFATRCIEAGVDIPTVSRWLGHSDGGVLAMRTYGHLRQDHSQAQAAKVNFGGGR
jgi:integrase